jgi:hypothetical protein
VMPRMLVMSCRRFVPIISGAFAISRGRQCSVWSEESEGEGVYISILRCGGVGWNSKERREI